MPANKHTKKIWEIYAKQGSPKTELEKKMETLRDELRPHTNKWQAIVDHVTQWKTTRNPHHMDFALQLCDKYEVPIQGVIQEEIKNSAVMRTSGSPSGTADSIVKNGILDMALLYVLNFRYHDLTLEDAAEKAAAIFAPHCERLSFNPYKASTIEKKYAARYRKKKVEEYPSFDEIVSKERAIDPKKADALEVFFKEITDSTPQESNHSNHSNHSNDSLEDYIFKQWSESPDFFNEHKQDWEEIIAAAPECPDYLKGSRR